MRLAHPVRLILATLAVAATPLAAQAQDVLAAAPHDLSVTVYRNPYREAGGFELDDLGGFALITETRRVRIPAGQHRVRFEGVADGIDPASAIVTGLPNGVIEKNRDAALISPSALIDAANERGGRVMRVRTNPLTGEVVRTEGTIRSGADGGVVFETPDGFEALRCTGLSETFDFEATTTGLSARPTLSVLTRTAAPVEAVVQLSYLAYGFDWAADYTGDLRDRSRKVDIGSWVTLANGNGTSFPNARVQIVAGRLNRDTGQIEPIDIGQPIYAQCWPQGTTSDRPSPIRIERAYPFGFGPGYPVYAMYGDNERDRVVVTGSLRAASPEDAAMPVTVFQEELGDLKLYRVPDRTTLASRQAKQVRMMDRGGVSVAKIYEAELFSDGTTNFGPVPVLLRTRNESKNNLGLPLPSGRVSVFETVGTGASAQRLLSGETTLRDLAVNEEVELRFNGGADVQVRQVVEGREVVLGQSLPFLRGFNVVNSPGLSSVKRIELSNARSSEIEVEVRLTLRDGHRVVKANRPAEQKDGRPIFRVKVPANSTLEIRYQTSPS